MTWELRWTDRGLKELSGLDSNTRVRIVRALDRQAQEEYGDVKRLRGRGGEWRLRVGAWRVLYEHNYDTMSIRVLRVLPRGQAYRD